MKPQPFLFDSNIFDEDMPLTEEERAKLPEFSKDEMEAARVRAYEEGKNAGLQESLESINNTNLVLLQKIERDLGVLFAAEEKRQKEYEQSATHLATQIFTKAFPTYMDAHGVNELCTAVSNALAAHMVPETIQIEINGSVFSPFTELIREHADNLQKQITFKADASLPDYACRISWPGGGLLCDRSALTEKIFNILNHSLAEHGFSLHDKADNKKDATSDKTIKADESEPAALSVEESTEEASPEKREMQSLDGEKQVQEETKTSGES